MLVGQKFFHKNEDETRQEKSRAGKKRVQRGCKEADGGLMITSVFPPSSPSPPPAPPPHAERCQSPVSCPSSCNLYRNIAAGRSCRLSGKERSRRDSRSLERSWRNVGRRKWFPILEFWTRIGRNLLLPVDPVRLPWKFPLGCDYSLP